MSTLDELRDTYACSCTNPAYSNANTWPEIEAAAALIAALEAENERLEVLLAEIAASSITWNVHDGKTIGRLKLTERLWDRIKQYPAHQEPTP